METIGLTTAKASAMKNSNSRKAPPPPQLRRIITHYGVRPEDVQDALICPLDTFVRVSPASHNYARALHIDQARCNEAVRTSS